MVLDRSQYSDALLSLHRYRNGRYDIEILAQQFDEPKIIYMKIGEDELLNWEDMARARLDRYLARTGGAQKQKAGHQA